jgi:outer membrane protein assembly factor BamA
MLGCISIVYDLRKFFLVGFTVAVSLAACRGVEAGESIRRTGVGGGSSHSEVDGRIIDSIEIDNRNVFNTSEPGYDNFLFKTANSLHMTTRRSVIRQEVLFDVGDAYSSDLVEETARNLRARYQLYDAWIETRLLDNGHLLVRIVTVDQWSFRVYVNFRREGNESDYQFGIEERNLLGYNKFLNMDYVLLQRDHNFFRTRYQDNRLGGTSYYLDLGYDGEPTDGVTHVILQKPFYNLDQRFSFGVALYERRARHDYYQDSLLAAQWHRRGDNFSMIGHYRWGEYKRKIGIWFQYDYNYQNVSDQLVFSPEDSNQIAFPGDSVYHRLMTGVNLEWLDFVKLRQINGFGYTEDFTLGQTVGLQVGRAFLPGLSKRLFDQVGFSFSAANMLGSNLFILDYRRDFWFEESTTFRETSDMSFRWFNNQLDFFTLAFRIRYNSWWSADGNNFLVLGGQSGLRGYDKYFQTGDRRLVGNIEGRFFPDIELLSVIFGGVLFTDFGQIWSSDEPVKLGPFDYSVGAGLRISLEKVSKKDLIRVDFAHTQTGTWELSFGTQQYF